MATNNTTSSIIINVTSANGKDFSIKTYTEKRQQNFAACDQKYYTFTADWTKEQDKKVCSDALSRAKKIMTYITAFDDDEGWGKKEDSTDVIDAVNLLLKKIKLGDDARTNSFTMYQVERYLNRVWYRGTKEQREAANEKLGYLKKAEKTTAKKAEKATTKKAETKAEAKPETKTTTRRSRKPAAKKAEDKPASPLDQMTAEQKRQLLFALMTDLLK